MTNALEPNFSAASALAYGELVEIAYAMFDAAKGNPTPPPPAIDGYEFIAWVTMSDFALTSGKPEFYGFLVESIAEPRQFIMAIRGTSDLEEWWDDLLAIKPVPWHGMGQVGYGFAQIYGTLKLHLKDSLGPPAAAAAAPPLTDEPFAAQVARVARRHRAARAAAATGAAPGAAPPAVAAAPIELNVTGHSLGSALATLYVAENAVLKPLPSDPGALAIRTPLLYTFASPRVGDPVFAAAFDALPITSWRIVNELDAVPCLPAIGFKHVEQQQLYNSGTQVCWTLGCWHSLNTYLHLIDAAYPLADDCRWSWSRSGGTRPRGAPPPADMPLLPTPDAATGPTGPAPT